MAKVGKIVIVGIVWIIIAVIVGAFGTMLSKQSGIVRIIGWIISVFGNGFAILSAIYLFKVVIGKTKFPEPSVSLSEFLPSIEEYASEADRTYRNFIKIYGEENSPIIISGKGLFTVRLIFSAFMPYIFMKLNPNKENECMDLLNIASGVAIKDLIDVDSFPAFSRDKAKEISTGLLKTVIAALTDEFTNGPSAPTNLTNGFDKLVNLYHGALCESIGSEHYTKDVKERFNHLVVGNVGVAINNIRNAL